MKDAYYFPHDSNAHNDPKIQKMLMSLKDSGYGAYWVIIEMLRNEKKYTLKKSDYEAIAYQSHSDINTIIKVVENFELFSFNNDEFWSESLKRRMITLEEKRNKLSEAGKRGNLIRWQSQGDGKAIAVKESKVKKSKTVSTGNSFDKNGLLFLKIIGRFPNRDGSKRAKISFESSVKTEKDFEDINKALENYLQCDAVKKGYVKNASTWFNNWQDWVDYKSTKQEIMENL